ncbi:MAG: hypothetical protein HC880_19300 [Bacteroidia bacterium]|nr:hypothetical protein [Bacteroidia bacterium]
MLGVNNHHIGVKLPGGDGKPLGLRVSIPQLLIYGEGTYWVSLYLGDNEDPEDFDVIEDAFSFELLKTNVYSSPTMLIPQLNLYYQPDLNIEYI